MINLPSITDIATSLDDNERKLVIDSYKEVSAKGYDQDDLILAFGDSLFAKGLMPYGTQALAEELILNESKYDWF